MTYTLPAVQFASINDQLFIGVHQNARQPKNSACGSQNQNQLNRQWCTGFTYNGRPAAMASLQKAQDRARPRLTVGAALGHDVKTQTKKVFHDDRFGVVCSLSSSGEVVCEGRDEGPHYQPKWPVVADSLLQVFHDSNLGVVCSLTSSGEVVCEGLDEGPHFQPRVLPSTADSEREHAAALADLAFQLHVSGGWAVDLEDGPKRKARRVVLEEEYDWVI